MTWSSRSSQGAEALTAPLARQSAAHLKSNYYWGRHALWFPGEAAALVLGRAENICGDFSLPHGPLVAARLLHT